MCLSAATLQLLQTFVELEPVLIVQTSKDFRSVRERDGDESGKHAVLQTMSKYLATSCKEPNPQQNWRRRTTFATYTEPVPSGARCTSHTDIVAPLDVLEGVSVCGVGGKGKGRRVGLGWVGLGWVGWGWYGLEGAERGVAWRGSVCVCVGRRGGEREVEEEKGGRGGGGTGGTRREGGMLDSSQTPHRSTQPTAITGAHLKPETQTCRQRETKETVTTTA